MSEDVVKVPAAGLSIVTDFPGGRQMTVQCYVAMDTPKEDIDALLDRLLSVVDRQKAINELPALEADLLKATRVLAQFREDFDRAESAFPLRVAKAEEVIAEAKRMKDQRIGAALTSTQESLAMLRASRETRFQEGLEMHRKDGRQGSYMPKGLVAQNLKAIDMQIESSEKAFASSTAQIGIECDVEIAALERALEVMHAERNQEIEGITISLKRHENEIQLLENEIGKRRTTVGD